MRIAVITDTHANLPALQAVLKSIQAMGYDAIYHTGDAIGIGPCPAECLEVLLETPRTYCLVGNHEDWLLHGLPTPRPEWLNDDISQHLQWTYDQISPLQCREVARWPYQMTEELGGVDTSFLHYARDSSESHFLSVDEKPSVGDLDRTFAQFEAAIVCFGHYHLPVDESGHRRYINPGSLGLHGKSTPRYSVIDFTKSGFKVRHCHTRYDGEDLFELFENRKMPGRSIIYKVFFDGRSAGR